VSVATAANVVIAVTVETVVTAETAENVASAAAPVVRGRATTRSRRRRVCLVQESVAVVALAPLTGLVARGLVGRVPVGLVRTLA